jgi:hypothetical protein
MEERHTSAVNYFIREQYTCAVRNIKRLMTGKNYWGLCLALGITLEHSKELVITTDMIDRMVEDLGHRGTWPLLRSKILIGNAFNVKLSRDIILRTYGVDALLVWLETPLSVDILQYILLRWI